MLVARSAMPPRLPILERGARLLEERPALSEVTHEQRESLVRKSRAFHHTVNRKNLGICEKAIIAELNDSYTEIAEWLIQNPINLENPEASEASEACWTWTP